MLPCSEAPGNTNLPTLRLRRPSRPPSYEQPPPIPGVDAGGIPEELRLRYQWVNWAYQWRKGKWTKVPLNPRSGKRAKSNDPSTWGAFEDALGRCDRHTGLGYVFSAGDPYVGVDLDKPFAEAGGLTPEAAELVTALNSYTEYSPSRRGLHVIVRADVPQDVVAGKSGTRHGASGVEVYGRLRYFTFTGMRLEGTPAEVREAQAEVDALCRQLKTTAPGKRAARGVTPGRGCWSNGLSDEQVIEAARAGANAEKFNRLWAGDTTGYPSPSEADFALLAVIAFYAGADPVQIERVFGLSALAARDKWDTDGYRRTSITNLLKEEREFWAPGPQDVAKPQRLARAFLARKGAHPDGPTVRRWGTAWYSWNGQRYEEYPKDELQAEVNRFLEWEFDRAYREQRRYHAERCRQLREEAARAAEQGREKTLILPAAPKPRHASENVVRNVLAALAGLAEDGASVLVPSVVEVNSWFDDEGRWEPKNWIAVQNGILDLDAYLAGRDALRPHSPRWFSLACVSCDYRPDATCPEWEKYLARVLDEERINLLQEYSGYCLSRDTTLEAFLALTGKGGNGKGVYLTVLEATLGKANVSHVGVESFDPRDRFSLTMTHGKLVNIVSDVGEMPTVAEGRLKTYVSGEHMVFDRKNLALLDAAPTARLILATNNLPRFSDTSNGIWRRLKPIPFDVEIPLEEQNPRMRDPRWWQDRGELPGVFLWMLTGLRRLHDRKGFTRPDASRRELEEHRVNSNPAKRFVQGYCRHTTGKHVLCDDLYVKYQLYCTLKGYKRVLDENVFGRVVVDCFAHLKLAKLSNKERRAAQRYTDPGTKRRSWGYPDLEYVPDGVGPDTEHGTEEGATAQDEVSQLSQQRPSN